MTDIRCEETGDCFLVPTQQKTDLVSLDEQETKVVRSIPKPTPKRKRTVPKKKTTKKSIKGRAKPKRVIPKKVLKRKGRNSAAKKKKSKKNTRR